MHLNVIHVGVPLGSVDLPEGRQWAGGLLEPTAAYEPIGAILREVTARAGPQAIASLLRLPAGEQVQGSNLSADAALALRKAAALDFELLDQAGRRVAADVVRIVDLNDGIGGRVAAHFRSAMADAPAWKPDVELGGDGENDVNGLGDR